MNDMHIPGNKYGAGIHTSLLNIPVFLIWMGFLGFISAPESCYAQKVLLYEESGQEKILVKSFGAPAERNNFIQQKLHKYISKGYLGAEFDTIQNSKDTLHILLSKDKPYRWDFISLTNPDILSYRQIRSIKILEGKKVSLGRFEKRKEKLLEDFENKGYPFFKVTSDSLKEKNYMLHLQLDMNRGKYISYDSLHFDKDVKISYKYLSNYTNIRYGEPYSEKSIQDLSKRISKLSFMRQNANPTVAFIEDKAKISLDITTRKSNQFNGIIGFQPNDENAALQFTGQFYINLVNSFKIAESFEFEWKKLEKNSQELLSTITFPYIFLGDFGIQAGLHIEKFDTLYVSTKSEFSILYNVNSEIMTRANSKFISSNVTTQIPQTNFIDFESRYLGLGFTINKLDYAVNPRNGLFVSGDFNFGKKHFQDSSKSLASLELLGMIQYHYELFEEISISCKNQTGMVQNDQIGENEKFKLGGIKNIRGFNEKSVITPAYIINTLEISYFLDQNSKLFVFYDQGWMNEIKAISFHENSFHALGAGINIETNAGVFSLIYALGKQPGTTFLFRDAKIHFGYISRF